MTPSHSLENFIRNDKPDADEGEIEVIDLGMCLQVPHMEEEDSEGHRLPVFLHAESCKGKPNYLSPERVREEEFDAFSSDIWSLGVCFYTLLTGRPVYSSPEDHAFRALARGGVKKVISLYEGYGLILPPQAKDLVCHMLHCDSMSRPTLEEILQHPYLVDDEEREEMVVVDNNNQCKGSHSCEDKLSHKCCSGSSSSSSSSSFTIASGTSLCKSHATV